jgi:hypothetical protein
MPMLHVFTHDDAEVFVLDAALSRVARSVGTFEENLSPGLYKIRVNRAGTIKEQLIELIGTPQQHRIFIHRFSAIAPIESLLPDSWRVERIARSALGRIAGRGILVLAHQSSDNADEHSPFRGARIFPWRATRDAISLDDLVPITTVIDTELWAAVAVKAEPADGPFVLELRRGLQLARQAVLVTKGWQTRIFLRADDHRQPGERPSTGPGTATPFDVSIQMARPYADVVYSDQFATMEVARSALERGRAIFTSPRLAHELFQAKYENPIAGLTGLHLFLDATARSQAADDSAYETAPFHDQLPFSAQDIADEVLVNLTLLLHPERVEAAGEQASRNTNMRQVLLYPDPAWPESPDLTALRLRAGRCREQIVVPSPPMFRVSWDVLTANAARDGMTWISRELWSSTGAAGSVGPYLAWARSRHSVKRTLQRIIDQFADWPEPGGTRPWDAENTEAAGPIPGPVGYGKTTERDKFSDLESIPSRRGPPTLESIMTGDISKEEKHILAARFGLPLSILEKALDKTGQMNSR